MQLLVSTDKVFALRLSSSDRLQVATTIQLTALGLGVMPSRPRKAADCAVIALMTLHLHITAAQLGQVLTKATASQSKQKLFV